MPKITKKSHTQRQKLAKVRKRDARATDKKEVSKSRRSSISNETDLHISNNSRDGASCMSSNSSESSSRECAFVDSTKVPSEVQAIIDRYLQSQKDLADRAKNIHADSHRAEKAVSEMCNDRYVKLKERRQQYNTEWKRRARSLPEFREYEQQHNKVNMQMARKDAAQRDSERKNNKKSMQMARKDSLYRDNERESNKNSKKMARKDTVYMDKEQESNKKSMQMARKDIGYRDAERECNKKSMQTARKEQAYRDNERECNKKSMQMARKDQVYRDNERECNKGACRWLGKTKRRGILTERNKKSKNMTRNDPLYRDNERDCDKKSKEMARENPSYRDNERECNKIHMNMARIDSVYRQNEQHCDTNRKKTLRNKQLSLDDLIKNFHSEVEKGPVHKCCVCDQLWYRHSVIIVRNSSLPDCPA